MAQNQSDLGTDEGGEGVLGLLLGEAGQAITEAGGVGRRAGGGLTDGNAHEALKDSGKSAGLQVGTEQGRIDLGGTGQALPVARAASNSANPSSAVMGSTPRRARRVRSASTRWPVMSLPSAHSPQTSEVAGRPSARRRWASASRKTFAAA